MMPILIAFILSDFLDFFNKKCVCTWFNFQKKKLILVRGKQLFLHKLENIIVDFKHLNSDLHVYNMHHLEHAPSISVEKALNL